MQVPSANPDDFPALLEQWRLRMESALAARLPAGDEVVSGAMPTRLQAAMRYSVLEGGKRIRPALLFATALTLGLREDDVEAAACAVELIHVYSLIHDDLPAMDDDDLRRGKPTCHKAFDEATAILAGDALQPLALCLLAADPALPAVAEIRVKLVKRLSDASGSFGMTGGQAIDLAAQGSRLGIEEVEDMHSRKTGALIRASVLMAADCRPDLAPELSLALERFAAAIGLAFQIQDDLLDVLGDAATLGKATGADLAHQKPTHPSIIGIPASQERVARLHAEALEALLPFGDRAAPLRALAAWLLSRRY
jgi:farnesyl diphosphate synthase